MTTTEPFNLEALTTGQLLDREVFLMDLRDDLEGRPTDQRALLRDMEALVRLNLRTTTDRLHERRQAEWKAGRR